MANSALIFIIGVLAVSVPLASAFIPDLFDLLANHPKLQNLPRAKHVNAFKFVNYNGKNDVANITDVSIEPDPVVFPGNVSLAFTVDNKVTEASNVGVDFVLKFKYGGPWQKVLSYKKSDVCPILEKQFPTCPEIFTRNHIPCKCPFPKGHYNFPKTSENIAVGAPFMGAFNVKLKLTYKSLPAGCADVVFVLL